MKQLRLKFSLSIVLGIILTSHISAQNTLKYDSINGSPKATIDQVSWLQGHWRGEAFGGQIDEVWSPPVSGSMMFAFQAEEKGKVTFYEFGTITEENNTLILRLKHFYGDLKGWEEKDDRLEWKFVKITADRAYFNNFTFERVGTDEINVYVVFKQSDGSTNEMKFSYHRMALP